MSDRALDALGQVLDRGGEPDDVLRTAVSALAREPGISFAAIAFVENSDTVLGPRAGRPDDSRRQRVPITYRGSPVGELWVDGEADLASLQRIAALLSAHVLVGWDTGGEAWEP